MKRWIHSSESVDWNDALQSILTIDQPSKFSSSSVKLPGLGKDLLEFRVSNMGSRGYQSELRINSNGASYLGPTTTNFQSAVDTFKMLFDKYVSYKSRFAGRNLSDSDIHEMMYT